MPAALIRLELPSDIVAVRNVQASAFGRTEEAKLVDVLRQAGDAVLSLVAVQAEAVVGHVMFSRMRAPFRALGLGPIGVLPDRQKQGIGSDLIRAGLERATAEGWEGVFVVGAPAFYGRFGFAAEQARGFQSPYAGPFLLSLSLGAGDLPTTDGRIDYAPAFAALE